MQAKVATMIKSRTSCIKEFRVRQLAGIDIFQAQVNFSHGARHTVKLPLQSWAKYTTSVGAEALFKLQESTSEQSGSHQQKPRGPPTADCARSPRRDAHDDP
jgi:hypothetical protein